MKTTPTSRRSLANPRRTTLAHLKDASELTGTVNTAAAEPAAAADPAAGTDAQAPAFSEIRVLPQKTANPRRTVLTELPKAPLVP